MQPEFFKVGTPGAGFLATMARPRSGEWAEDEFGAFAEAGIVRIVSLLEYHESVELGLANEAALCNQAGIEFVAFPLADRSVPVDSKALFDFSEDVHRQCANGASTAIHCRGGIGRSSVVATAVLLHAGSNVTDALDAISAARGLPVPDTDEQRNWLIDYAARHHA